MPVRSMQLRTVPFRWKDGVIKCGVCLSGSVCWLKWFCQVACLLSAEPSRCTCSSPLLFCETKRSCLTSVLKNFSFGWRDDDPLFNHCDNYLHWSVPVMSNWLRNTEKTKKLKINMFLHPGDSWKRQFSAKSYLHVFFYFHHCLFVHLFPTSLLLSALLTDLCLHQ